MEIANISEQITIEADKTIDQITIMKTDLLKWMVTLWIIQMATMIVLFLSR